MPEEDKIEELKKQRREELENQTQSEEEQLERQRDQIKEMASKYLTSEARSRLNNIRMAKPDLASSVETQIARLGRMGQIDNIDDDKLKQILKEIQGSKDNTDIKFRR